VSRGSSSLAVSFGIAWSVETNWLGPGPPVPGEFAGPLIHNTQFRIANARSATSEMSSAKPGNGPRRARTGGSAVVVIGKRGQVAGGVVQARLGLPCRHGFRLRLAQLVESVLSGVRVGVGQVREIALWVVAVLRGVLRIGTGRLNYRLQLVRRVVGVLHQIAHLVRHAGEVAGAIVGVLGGGGVVVRGLWQAAARVVLLLGLVIVGNGYLRLVTGIVVNVCRGLALRVYRAGQTAGGVVVVRGGVVQRVSLGPLAAVVVVGVGGGGVFGSGVNGSSLARS